MAKIGLEEIEHLKTVEWLKQMTDLPFYHYANERKCTPMEGVRLMRLGVKPGVADLHLPRSNETYKDLWIELKSKDGRVSEAQANFLRERIEEGSCAEIAYSSEEAIEIIKSFYGLPSTTMGLYRCS